MNKTIFQESHPSDLFPEHSGILEIFQHIISRRFVYFHSELILNFKYLGEVQVFVFEIDCDALGPYRGERGVSCLSLSDDHSDRRLVSRNRALLLLDTCLDLHVSA